MEQKQLDKNEILRLAKIVSPTSSDITSIYNLYCKYVKPGAPFPSTNGRCSSCGNSIVKYWRELLSWFNSNQSFFDI
jgi:hypothetical protein